MVRWWDGYRWHEASFPPWSVLARPDPVGAMRSERAASVWARRAMWIAAAFPALAGIGFAAFFGFFFSTAWETCRNGEFGCGNANHVPVGAIVVFIVSFLAGFVAQWGSTIALIIWSYRASRHARDLGYPAQLEPLWAILGWLLPFIQYFFPYWVLRDCLRPDNPERRRVLHWWLLYTLGQLAIFLCMIVGLAIAAFGGIAWIIAPVVLAGLVAYAVTEARLGIRVIDLVEAEHDAATAWYVGSAAVGDTDRGTVASEG